MAQHFLEQLRALDSGFGVSDQQTVVSFVALVSLSKILYHDCFGLRMGL